MNRREQKSQRMYTYNYNLSCRKVNKIYREMSKEEIVG